MTLDEILDDIAKTIEQNGVFPKFINVKKIVNSRRGDIEKWLKRNRKNLLKYLKEQKP